MRTPLSPWGILLGHTVPAAILIMLYVGMLSVVHPLLSQEALDQWWLYGGILAGVTVLSTIYALVLLRHGRSIHFGYSLFTFLAYIPLLYAFMNGFRELLPWEVPRWMVPRDAELYALRLLSVPLAHALFVLIISTLQRNERGSPFRDIGIAIAIPLAVYVFVQVIEPWRFDVDFERHTWVVLFIALVLTFLFFVLRGITALAMRAGPSSAGIEVVLRLLVALIFPLVGLAINNGELGWFDREASGIVGDLDHWGFYAVAIINALVVIWPSSANPNTRLIQFILRAAGFSYVCYFFLLFLPFLPLSIVAIIAVGIGFLLLAPVMLFAVQGTQLVQDARFLVAHRSRRSLVGIFILSFATLPLMVTAKYMWHRKVLHEALEYVYHSTLRTGIQKPLDASAIETVLDHVQDHKGRGRSGHTPFLTPYYNRVVLDNLTLSDARVKDLRTIFLNEFHQKDNSVNWRNVPAPAELDTATTNSVYDEEQQAWRTWVELTMSHHLDQQGEYVTTFNLPDGAWISDEYLMIQGERVKGILAEKKAAEWVYNQIVNVRRDPSITRYIGPGKVQVRVFPFEKNEVRQAGFEVLHKELFTLHLEDSCRLTLGDDSRPAITTPITTPDGSTTYISETVKRALTSVQRSKAYHFIVDGTEEQRGHRESVVRMIDGFLSEQRIAPSTATVHISDAYHETHRWSEGGAQAFLTHAGNGGFFSDRAVRSIITASCDQASAATPMIIFVGSMPPYYSGLGVWLDDLDDVAGCLPEGAVFYSLGESGAVDRHAFAEPTRSLNREPETLERPSVLAWPNATEPTAFLPLGGPSIIVHGTVPMLDKPMTERNWASVLLLEGAWRAHQLEPSGGSARWRELVRGSFQAQVMTPVTAWMCLEDEAQRNALLKKQDEVLSADQALDTEDITAMSEPEIWWLLLPLLLYLGVRWRRG
ncbi:MAG: MSEP-CTERM sorting domain-containing protein [Flavobacteriales bacterium]|nr:MSEP-CTERM sorting domain-containing protein [Flavobacteriales bacterium]